MDPHTAALTVTSNALPQVVDSVPIRLRTVDSGRQSSRVHLQRDRLLSAACRSDAHGPQRLQRDHGSSANVSSPYTASGCKSLKFAPKFSVSTSGRTSKARGRAYGDAALAKRTAGHREHHQGQGRPAQAFPSRLTTLQKACLASGSKPTLPLARRNQRRDARRRRRSCPSRWKAPRIFVSPWWGSIPEPDCRAAGRRRHGRLVGSTFISKAGVTRSTFKTVPDVPFSTFAADAPGGKYSALAANCQARRRASAGRSWRCRAHSRPRTAPKSARAPRSSVEGCSSALSFTHKVKKKTLTLHYLRSGGRQDNGQRQRPYDTGEDRERTGRANPNPEAEESREAEDHGQRSPSRRAPAKTARSSQRARS